MKIETTLLREGGTDVVMKDGTVLKFRPDDDGKHVCDVDNTDHVASLLAIPEGYRPYAPAGKKAPVNANGAPVNAPPPKSEAKPAPTGLHMKRGFQGKYAIYDGDKKLTQAPLTKEEAATMLENMKARAAAPAAAE